MTKKQRESISYLIQGFTVLGGLYIIFKFSLGWQYLLGLLLLSVLLYGIVLILLPDKKKVNKKQTSRKNNKPLLNTGSKNKTNKVKSQKELLSTDIDILLGDDFEELVYLYFKDKGFNPIKTGKSGDHGVDLVIKDPKDGLQIAVQCKRYKKENKIGNGDIIKLQGGKRFYKCPGALFIT